MALDVLVTYVNGKRHEVKNPSPNRTLLEFLREDLRLTGTKNSCLEGACNACTVTVSQWDRQEERVRHSAMTACLTRLCSLHGKAVTTVEGLGSVKRGLHPVQERIYKAHGSQCGFCTPGMVMSMSSLLREKESIEEKDVHLALQGNLCRCTGYRAILEGFRTFCSDAQQEQEDCGAGDRVATFDPSSFAPYSRESDDPAFPAELRDTAALFAKPLHFIAAVEDGRAPHWHVPNTLDELATIAKIHGDAVEFVAGGTGHFKKPVKKTRPAALIQVGNIQELHKVEKREGGMFYGSAVTVGRLRDLCKKVAETKKEEETAAFRLLADVLTRWVCAQVRNAATIGGHVGWAHPSSDLVPILMAVGCTLDVADVSGAKRTVAVDADLFDVAYENTLKPTELVLGLTVPFSKAGEVGFFYRRARRKEFDLAVANACFYGKVEGGKAVDVKVAIGGMEAAFPGARASPPRLARKTMEYVAGKDLGAMDKKKLAKEVFADVFVEERAPGQFSNYRRCLVAVFVERFLADLGKKGEAPDKSVDDLAVRGHSMFEVAESDQAELDPVQRPTPHNWAAEQASGVATYIDDMPQYEGMLHVVPILSERPHAYVDEMDFGEAMKAAGKGVVGTLTPKDVPYNAWSLMPDDHDEALIAKEAKYMGQIIGALVCADPKEGRRVRHLVRVKYTDLPHVIDMADSEDEPAPVWKIKRETEVEPEGKTVTVKGTVRCGGQEHLYLETQRAVAVPATEKDELTVYASSQDPNVLEKAICTAFRIPRHKVTVRAKRVGGGFGGKERPQLCFLAAAAAIKFGRPSKVCLTTCEDFKTSGHRQHTVMDYEVTGDEAGKVVSFKCDAKFDMGCSLDQAHFVAYKFVSAGVDGGYTWKNFDGTSRCYKTNGASTTAMRGFGTPEGHLLAEVAMEHLAHELKMDPIKVKEANLTKEGDLLHYLEQTADGCAQEDCWNEVLKRSKFEEKKKEIEEFNKVNKIKKRGISVMPMKFPMGRPGPGDMQSNAYIRIYSDGTVLLNHAGVEMGQGLHTKMIQVCSRALGVDMSKIHVEDTNTGIVVDGTGTGASVGSDINGPAVIDACRQLNERLAPIKEKYPDGTWEDWVQAAYVGLVNLSAVGHYNNPKISFNPVANTGRWCCYHTYAAGVIEAEVDCHTGDITVLSAEIVFDLGKSINPAIDVTQIEGGFTQGLGWATTEQLLVCPKTGELLTTSPSTYKAPTVANVPKSFNVTLLTYKEGRPTSACYSSKGVGEPPLVLGLGLSCAVREAVASYRSDHGNHDWFHMDVPMTGDKVRMACTDEYTRAAEEAAEKVAEKDKLAIEI